LDARISKAKRRPKLEGVGSIRRRLDRRAIAIPRDPGAAVKGPLAEIEYVSVCPVSNAAAAPNTVCVSVVNVIAATAKQAVCGPAINVEMVTGPMFDRLVPPLADCSNAFGQWANVLACSNNIGSGMVSMR